MTSAEGLRKPLHRIPDEPSDETPLASLTLPLADVDASEDQHADDAEDDHRSSGRKLSEPRRARDRRDADDEEADQDEEVESPIQDHGAEGLSVRHSRL